MRKTLLPGNDPYIKVHLKESEMEEFRKITAEKFGSNPTRYTPILIREFMEKHKTTE